MNFSLVWSAIQPLLTQLLASPQFQAVIMKIITDINAKIAAGVPPSTAVQHATGQLGAAAALHLTGNPIADAQAWLANFKPPTGSTIQFPPPVPVPGAFTS